MGLKLPGRDQRPVCGMATAGKMSNSQGDYSPLRLLAYQQAPKSARQVLRDASITTASRAVTGRANRQRGLRHQHLSGGETGIASDLPINLCATIAGRGVYVVRRITAGG